MNNFLFSRLRIKNILSAALCASTLFSTITVTNRATAQKPAQADDPMLKAMQTELDREKTLLLLPGMQRPYFIEYRMEDVHTYEAIANYGALTREEENRQRVVRVSVRIGDYTSDNSTGRGDGVIQLAALDNDPNALRYALWTATDEAYKIALRTYSSKQATLRQFQGTRSEQDFAPAKPIVHITPLVTMELDRKDWRKRIVEASGLYTNDPEVRAIAQNVQFSTANIRAIAVNRYLVNTEGTILRQGYTGYNDGISVGGQAADGMRLSRDNGTTGVNAKDLESWPALRKRTINNLKSFEELRNAPVIAAEDYHGPVLFSDDAATDVVRGLFVPNIEADRPEMGTTARTTGAYTSSYKARVLPDILSVTDDPRQTKFAGRAVLGAYEVDDEGVPAQAVDVVVKGMLENYLIGREPVKDFPASNGHGRAAIAQAAHSRAGVLFVKAAQPLSVDEMNKRLLELAKVQSRDVYAVETLGGELAPRLLYRVHPDGSRQLVRGAVFDELDPRTLRSDIVAAGNDPYVSDSLGAIPQTTITPSLLFDDVGVKRATLGQEKLPYYAPPALDGR